MGRLKGLRQLRKAVNKDHGRGTMSLSANMQPLDIPRLPSGSLALDFALGGGLPVGRTIIYWGEEAGGKTTNALRTAGMCQNICANCYRPVPDIKVVETVDPDTGEVEFDGEAHCDCYKAGIYQPRQLPDEKDAVFKARLKELEKDSYESFRVALIDQEGSWNTHWATRLGIDRSRLVYVRPDTAEEAIDIYVNLLGTGSVDLMIVDSIAAMTPSAEVEASAEDWQQGLQARLVNKWNRTSQTTLNAVVREHGRTPTQLWINQLRYKIGVKFGSPEVMPAGMGQKFSASVMVKMWASKWEKEDFMDLKDVNKQEMAKKVRMNFKVNKNKTAPSQVSGGYTMLVAGPRAGDVDEEKYVLDLAEKFGVVERVEVSKSKVEWRLGDEVFKTQKAMMERFREPKVYNAMRKGLLERMLKRRDEE